MITPTLAAFADVLAARLDGHAVVERDVAIARFTTYRVGGPASVFVRVDSVATVTALAGVVAEYRPPLLVIGKGSNLLVADAGFDGLALVLDGELAQLEIDPDRGEVRAGAGVPLQSLARATASAGQHGLEFFVGIPGTVGGAVRMNAGGHGSETGDRLVSVEVCALGERSVPETRTAESLGLRYRHSDLGPDEIVLSAVFELTPAPVAECEATIAEIVRWRKEHQPGGSNAGSVFRNPPGDSAGRLIDEVGLKGFRVGGAIVSAKHANFFQAEAGATADDVYRLVLEVRARVLAATGIELTPELRLLGFTEHEEQG